MAKSMGFTDLQDSYGPAMALGGADFKAFDLAYGYAVLANGGVMAGQDTFAPRRADERTVEPVGILQVVDNQGNVRFDIEEHRIQQQIVPPEQAYLITDILSDPGARCITFGCGGLAIPGHRAAVKTGTSEPFDPQGPNAGKIGETWAFGYTPDIVVGVWAGNANNAPIDHIFSTSISYRAMRDILLEAYKGRTATAFQVPEGIVRRQNCAPGGQPQQPNAQPGSPPVAARPTMTCTSEIGVR
jgi:membrane peptidoglycan carboxypeptidase